MLKAVAEKAGWTPEPGPSGRGRGIACGVDSGTYAALMAEVSVDRENGAVTVERVVCAQDMGVVVNPDGARCRWRAASPWGWATRSARSCASTAGRCSTRTSTPTSSRASRGCPRIETVLVKNDALPPQGGGEPAIVPMGAVLANAVFDATGERITRLPMTPERLKAALGKRRA